jgi:hypothetical protein
VRDDDAGGAAGAMRSEVDHGREETSKRGVPISDKSRRATTTHMPSLVLRTGLLFAALAAAGSTVTSAARAEPGGEALSFARALFLQAERDEDAGRWADARTRLEQVAKVKLTAGVRYHLALCDEHLGRVATALAGFTAAQDEAFAENAQDVLRLVGQEVSPLVARVPRLSIRVSPAVAGTRVTLDGAIVPAEQIGATLPVDPGLHRVEATAPGRLPTHTEVTLNERDVTFLDVVLQPATAPESATSRSPGGNAALASTPPPAGPAGPNLVAPIVMSAAAIALAGAGLGAYLAAGSAHDNAVDQCKTSYTFAPGACDSLKQPVRSWDWVAAGAWAGAAVTASVAVVLWVQKSSGPARGGSGQLVFGPGSIGAFGSF